MKKQPSVTCQVEGCTAVLSNSRSYFLRQKICEEHARAESVPDGRGGLLRFCQQCTKLEPLSLFEGNKRSCRASLLKRHDRHALRVLRGGGGAANPGQPSQRRLRSRTGRTLAWAEDSSSDRGSFGGEQEEGEKEGGGGSHGGSPVPTRSASSARRCGKPQPQLQQQQQQQQVALAPPAPQWLATAAPAGGLPTWSQLFGGCLGPAAATAPHPSALSAAQPSLLASLHANGSAPPLGTPTLLGCQPQVLAALLCALGGGSAALPPAVAAPPLQRESVPESLLAALLPPPGAPGEVAELLQLLQLLPAAHAAVYQRLEVLAKGDSTRAQDTSALEQAAAATSADPHPQGALPSLLGQLSSSAKQEQPPGRISAVEESGRAAAACRVATHPLLGVPGLRGTDYLLQAQLQEALRGPLMGRQQQQQQHEQVQLPASAMQAGAAAPAVQGPADASVLLAAMGVAQGPTAQQPQPESQLLGEAAGLHERLAPLCAAAGLPLEFALSHLDTRLSALPGAWQQRGTQ